MSRTKARFRCRSRPDGVFHLLTLESRLLLSATPVADDDGPELPPIFELPVALDGGAPTMPITGFAPTGSEAVGDLQRFHSLASARVKIYLDFVGAPAQQWGSYNAPAEGAYSSDSDPTTFSGAEQSQIYETWARVAEKFSPFNVDVTTEDPGNRAPYQTVTIIFASEDGSSWDGGIWGGIAFVGSFTNTYGNGSGYVFPQNLGPDVPQYMAEAAAHEAGHAFGLQHQSTFDGATKTAEYNPGTALSAPVMGNSYSAQRGLWWSGLNTYDTNQDDMSVIASASNGFGYRPDDHPNGMQGDPLAVSGSNVSGAGVIETMSDSDSFSLSTSGGAVSLTANSAPYGAMLNLRLDLYTSGGILVATANDNTFSETISTTLAAGVYELVVSPNGGYGNVGQYSITGTVPVAPPPAPGIINFTLVTTNAASLVWSNVPDATGFAVLRSTNGYSYSQVATVGADVTAFTDTGLVPATPYFYRLVAVNSAGTSPASPIGYAITMATTLAVPTALSATALANGRVMLTWNDANYTTLGVKIEMSTDGINFSQIDTVTLGTNAYTTIKLTSLRHYWFRIRAYDLFINSDYSNVGQATIQTGLIVAASGDGGGIMSGAGSSDASVPDNVAIVAVPRNWRIRAFIKALNVRRALHLS